MLAPFDLIWPLLLRAIYFAGGSLIAFDYVCYLLAMAAYRVTTYTYSPVEYVCACTWTWIAHMRLSLEEARWRWRTGSGSIHSFTRPSVPSIHPSIHTHLTSTYPCCIITTATAQHTVGKTWEARKTGSGSGSLRVPTYRYLHTYVSWLTAESR